MQNPELEKIAREYEAGKFKEKEDDLKSFLTTNAEMIYDFKDKLSRRHKTDVPISGAVKVLLLERKSVNPVHEIFEQKGEIEKEAWNRQEWDHEKVARDWAAKYAAKWRESHVLILGYVISIHETEYADLLEKALMERKKASEQAST